MGLDNTPIRAFWGEAMPAVVKVVLLHARRSFDEFKFILLLSLMPVWLGALLHLITSSSALSYLNNYLENGEALLICTATVGPLLYVILNDDRDVSDGHRPFPGKLNYVALIVLICVVSAAILGLKTALKEALVTAVSIDAVWLLSLIISIGSILLWFLVSGTKSARETGAPDIMRKSSDDFTRKFQEASDE